MSELTASATWHLLDLSLRDASELPNAELMGDIFDLLSRLEGFLEYNPEASQHLHAIRVQARAMRKAAEENSPNDVKKARVAAINACGHLHQMAFDQEHR